MMLCFVCECLLTGGFTRIHNCTFIKIGNIFKSYSMLMFMIRTFCHGQLVLGLKGHLLTVVFRMSFSLSCSDPGIAVCSSNCASWPKWSDK